MFLVLFTIYNWLSLAISLPWRLIMKPLVNWCKGLATNHFHRTIRNENIVLRAVSSSQSLPYLYLKWTLNNGSETRIKIRRICASLYLGDRWIGSFDVHDPIQKEMGAGTRHQTITVRSSTLSKGDTSDIEYHFYPTIEFWTMSMTDLQTPILLDGKVEIVGYGVNASIRLVDSNLKIDGIKDAVSQYKTIMFERLQNLKALT